MNADVSPRDGGRLPVKEGGGGALPPHGKKKRAKDLFGDCALVEIIHLHDCLRGAVGALQRDVAELSRTLQRSNSAGGDGKGRGDDKKAKNGTTHADAKPDAKAEAEAETPVSRTKLPGASVLAAPTEVQDRITKLERRVAGRFKVIWSVFRAHSAAEDEFIWPALQSKQAFRRMESSSSDLVSGSVGGLEGKGVGDEVARRAEGEARLGLDDHPNGYGPSGEIGGSFGLSASTSTIIRGSANVPLVEGTGRGAGDASPPVTDGAAQEVEDTVPVIEQEEYEEDHADEERMFRDMDALLTQLREGLSQQRRRSSPIAISEAGSSVIVYDESSTVPSTCSVDSGTTKSAVATTGGNVVKGLTGPVGGQEETEESNASVREMARKIDEITSELSQHLMTHLEKEETQCMPLVMKHLTKSEIHDLVGKIMGKRSSDMMIQILTMAVQNLSEADRDEMVRHMKQAMVGTFFERWLGMGGWMAEKKNVANGRGSDMKRPANIDCKGGGKKIKVELAASCKRNNSPSVVDAALCSMCTSAGQCLAGEPPQQLPPQTSNAFSPAMSSGSASTATASLEASVQTAVTSVTTPQELERLIRAIASNPKLTPVQKNTTIQGLRDSVWKSRANRSTETGKVNQAENTSGTKRKREESAEEGVAGVSIHAGPVSPATATRCRRVTPPSAYYTRGDDNEIQLVWSSDSPSTKFPPDDQSVPLFSASELAPTYHDGATGAVLGCPHYARSCKLRHPSSGRLYTCRLCCEQEREMPTKDKDSPLDRYAVTEVLCMRCGALQPAGDKCCNPKCEFHFKPYAKYSCNICNFYDDSPQKNIYHCPFCNVCRSGLGLGIDYRHCMRCNACVSLSDDSHHCIPQRLQGNCPICHDSMFQSTEPLRGLKCGHVMHLSCFAMYMRGQSYTCPLCKKSVEDMKDYFALLDAAVRMQPMPAAYSNMVSSIYCQDCGKTGSVRYHFVGCKCSHCGSYNTRELGRYEGGTSGSVQH